MPAESLGLTIAKRRGLLGLSQEELAARVGVSRDTVSKWETDAFRPRKSRLGSLEQVLGVSLSGEPEPDPNEAKLSSIDGLDAAQLARLVDAYRAIRNGTAPPRQRAG